MKLFQGETGHNDGQIVRFNSCCTHGVCIFRLGAGDHPVTALREAYTINHSGQIVGRVATSSGRSDGFLYSGGTTYNIYALPGNTDPPQRLSSANCINNLGWIVGTGEARYGDEVHAFLLTPVPEPSSFTALSALAGLALLRRRRVR